MSKEAKEAEVYLSDGRFEIICFSHPFNQETEENILLPLYALNAKDIHFYEENEFSVEKEGSTFEYKLTGYVVNKDDHQIKVGEFIIQLDIPLLNEVQKGDYISFVCDRIDIY